VRAMRPFLRPACACSGASREGTVKAGRRAWLSTTSNQTSPGHALYGPQHGATANAGWGGGAVVLVTSKLRDGGAPFDNRPNPASHAGGAGAGVDLVFAPWLTNCRSFARLLCFWPSATSARLIRREFRARVQHFGRRAHRGIWTSSFTCSAVR